MFERFPYTNFHEQNDDILIEIIKELENAIGGIENLNQETLSKLQPQIDELKKIVSSFDSNFVKSVIDSYVMTGVYFGLTDSGYFTVQIPSAWADVKFSTSGLDIVTDHAADYGHLILSY